LARDPASWEINLGVIHSVLIAGDTLFIGGCGKFFEGTPQQMYSALCEVLSSLPHDTLVFCGHEYTVSNLRFAAHVEPHNAAVSNKMDWAKVSNILPQTTVSNDYILCSGNFEYN
jgi:hydroxyacylglutathione hydrolase